jgi:MoxR-like ATPase/Mg-chelatase subunit ChlD
VTAPVSPAGIFSTLDERIVGLRRESEVLVSSLRSGCHIVLEGPPGTGKSTLLRAVADAMGWGLEFVEGNAELTPGRLLGAFDPALVLDGGYRPEAFTPGPLLNALREGTLLYMEELNRVPEETLNVLITALAEGEVHVPRLGHQPADTRFRLIAAMNPFDAVGTARVGQAIYDRMCRIAMGYQDEDAERAIVRRVTGVDGDLHEIAVSLARATRTEVALRTGSSVRGAVDMVLVSGGLVELRGEPPAEPPPATLLDAALAAFSGRVRLQDGGAETAETVIARLLERILHERRAKKAPAPPPSEDGSAGPLQTGVHPPTPDPPAPAPPRGGVEGDAARRSVQEAARRTTGRDELARRHPQLQRVSPQVGQLDEGAFAETMSEDRDRALALLADLASATDPELRRQARALAARVVVSMVAPRRSPERGIRRLVTAPGLEGEIELERTLERADGRRAWAAEDLVVRQFRASPRPVCLLVDRSGSMRGQAVAMAALAAAAVVLAATRRADSSVLAFADEPLVLQGQGQRRAATELVDALLSLRGRGTTDLAAALRAGAAQLERCATGAERIVLLMSDCLPTAGGDPHRSLAGIDRLHVLGTSEDPEALSAGRELAQRGGGRHLLVRGTADIGPAVSELLT